MPCMPLQEGKFQIRIDMLGQSALHVLLVASKKDCGLEYCTAIRLIVDPDPGDGDMQRYRWLETTRGGGSHRHSRSFCVAPHCKHRRVRKAFWNTVWKLHSLQTWTVKRNQQCISIPSRAWSVRAGVNSLPDRRDGLS
jgi:hypothetical protein